MELPKSNCPKYSELEQLNSILIKSCTDFKNETEQLKEETENLRVENAKLIAENVALKNLQSIAGCTKTPLLQKSSPSTQNRGPQSKAGFTKTPLAGDQKPLLGEPIQRRQKSASTQNGGQNLSTIVTCTTSNGIFLFLDLLFWITFTGLTAYFLSITSWSWYHHDMDLYGQGYNCPGIITYLTISWFSLLFETLGTILKHNICMLVGCVLTAILLGLSVDMTLLLNNHNLYINIYGFFFALFASIWNFARFAFQIKVIRTQQPVTRNHGYDIFISLDILFWIVFTCLTVYVYCTIPFPAWSPFMYIPWCIPGYIPTGVYITLCWFSVLFETLATIMEHKICMIAVCVLTVILFGLSVFMSLVLLTTGLIDIWSTSMQYGMYLAFFASIWNLARFSFQINVIQWIRSTNGHSIHTEETGYIPLLPQTVNGYQSI